MKLLTNIIGFFVVTFFLSSAVWADTMTIPNNFTSGEKAVAADVNANFSAAKAAVDANHARITTLEGKSPAIARIMIPVSGVSAGGTMNADGTAILPDAANTTAYGSSYARPADYVSGDITIKAIINSCGGADVAYESGHPTVNGVNIGLNTIFLKLIFCADGACPTVSIPAGGILTSWYAVEVSHTLSGFSDINTPIFTRKGSDTNDTCGGALTVRGFIVEYPRGQ